MRPQQWREPPRHDNGDRRHRGDGEQCPDPWVQPGEDRQGGNRLPARPVEAADGAVAPVEKQIRERLADQRQACHEVPAGEDSAAELHRVLVVGDRQVEKEQGAANARGGEGYQRERNQRRPPLLRRPAANGRGDAQHPPADRGSKAVADEQCGGQQQEGRTYPEVQFAARTRRLGVVEGDAETVRGGAESEEREQQDVASDARRGGMTWRHAGFDRVSMRVIAWRMIALLQARARLRARSSDDSTTPRCSR